MAVLLERLKNEITRCVTINAFNTIVNSQLKLDLSKVLPDVLPLLADFLRKDQRTLRVSNIKNKAAEGEGCNFFLRVDTVKK